MNERDLSNAMSREEVYRARYERERAVEVKFAGYTKAELIAEIVRLTEALRDLREQVERLR